MLVAAPRTPAVSSLALLILVLAWVGASPARGADAQRPVWARSGARLSAAGERMLREEVAGGRGSALAVARRFGLDRPEPEDEFAVAPGDAIRVERFKSLRTLVTNLAPDAQVNNKVGDAMCGSCGSRPLGQAETTIASLGSNMLAGWNDTKGFCTGGAVHGYATSTDGGTSWSDGGDVPALPTGGRYRGDPVHAVNRKSGRFYILGLYEGGANGSGLALCYGKFPGGGVFTFENNLQIAVGGADFLDKEWFGVDSVTGNVYVSWTNFPGAGGDQIEFRAFDSLGVALAPMQVLSSPAGFGNVQGSRPVVGPDGELYVVWYEYGFPLSHIRIRRSNDSGASFGPEETVADFYENSYSGAPGYRRPFAPTLPSIAVDASDGPRRGRLYVTWDEAVNFYDTAFSTASPISEIENDGFFASATPFSAGSVLRGSLSSSGDVDFFRFSGLKGQTVFFACDSASNNTSLNMRVVCGSDTSTFNSYRLLAFNQGTFPAIAWTLPANGTFYLRLSSAVATAGNYRIQTAFDVPSAGERARDHRDQFAAESDDGAAWSTPVMITDSDAGFDGIFPEVTVDGLGRAHAFWHDFRSDAACGALSYEVVTSSGDGGAVWGVNRTLSDASSYWSFNSCGSANQGDYQGITSEGANVYPCWSDSRLGDPDVFMECSRLAFSSACAPSAVALASAAAPDTAPAVGMQYSLKNEGNASADLSWSLQDDRGFLVGATPGLSGTVTLAPGDSQIVTLDYKSGTCLPAGTNEVRFITSDARIPGSEDTCATSIPCFPPAAVVDATGAGLAFDPPRPNPASGSVQFRYVLPHAGDMRLAIFSVSGRRVRGLASGLEPAGGHVRTWDGRDDHGRRVPPGTYFARLEADGRVVRRVVTLLK